MGPSPPCSSRIFFIFRKGNLYSLNNNPSLFLSLTPGKHHSTLCLYGFDYSSYFLKMKLHSIIIFVTGLFYFKVHPCWNMSEFPSFLSLNNIPLHINSPSYPFIHRWDTWVAFPFGLFVNNVVMKRVYKYLFKFLLSILWGTHSKTELVNNMVILCLIFWGTVILFS